MVVDIVREQGLLLYFYHDTNHEQLVFALDGAPTDIAIVTKVCIKDIELKMLNWPPNSLDLNPLENLWLICKDRVQKINRSKNKEQI